MDWISVKDRLPELNEWVIILIEYNGKYLVTEDTYIGKGEWKYGDSKVLGWLPIPDINKLLAKGGVNNG